MAPTAACDRLCEESSTSSLRCVFSTIDVLEQCQSSSVRRSSQPFALLYALFACADNSASPHLLSRIEAKMSSIRKVGLALAALGYAARRAAAVDVGTCAALLQAVSSAADTATSISLTTSFACSQTVSISDDQDITIDGADNTITISNSFTSSVSTGSSLFSNLGSLSITNLIVTESGDDLDTAGVRAIHNEGALTISSCEFQGLNVRTEISDRMAQGGVVSNW